MSDHVTTDQYGQDWVEMHHPEIPGSNIRRPVRAQAAAEAKGWVVGHASVPDGDPDEPGDDTGVQYDDLDPEDVDPRNESEED